MGPAANFGHQGYAGIGVLTKAWANGSLGGRLGTGGAWYDAWRFDQAPKFDFPAPYRRGFFHTLWGSNSGARGQFTFIPAGSTSPREFANEVFASDGAGDDIKPVAMRMGPDGSLYYLLTDYETPDGRVHRIRFHGRYTSSIPR